MREAVLKAEEEKQHAQKSIEEAKLFRKESQAVEMVNQEYRDCLSQKNQQLQQLQQELKRVLLLADQDSSKNNKALTKLK